MFLLGEIANSKKPPSFTTTYPKNKFKRNMKNGLPKRKDTRLHEFDYDKHGAYFITICTEGRRCILSEIICDDGLLEQSTSNIVCCNSLVCGQSRTPVPTDETIKNLFTGKGSAFNASVGDGVLDIPLTNNYKTLMA